jgi:hypothetical protein
MARRRFDDKGDKRAGVVRRSAGDRRQIPPEVEALASGRIDRLPEKARRPRLKDPRAIALVPGVANRDARSLFEARVQELRAALEAGEAGDALAHGLAEAIQLGLWRGRSVTGFDAFAEQVLDMAAPEARALAERGALAMGVPCERASDEAVAVWMRCEVCLRDAGIPGRVRLRCEGGAESLMLDIDVTRAPEALDAIGHRMGPLARDRRDGPSSR